MDFSKDEEVEFEFTLDEINEVVGAQFTLEFNNEKLKFDHIEVNNELLTNDELGMSNINKGLINVSWVKPEKGYFENGKLFTVVFKALADANANEVLRLTNLGLKAEAYNDKYEIENLSLNFRNENTSY
ncbi:MAG: cohesin domain-containing protein [Saprospiraceae bacterium]